MSKQILTRIKQKHEVEADWNNAKGFYPYEGELIVYDADAAHPYPRFKVGDGVKNVIDLPFSDVDYCHLEDLDGVSANLTNHASNATHITSTERTNWNAAHTHSLAAHAPSNAQANQNAFSNVKVGSTTVAADTTTDTLTLVGSNVTLTPDATNDKITIGITKANVTAALGYTPPTTDSNSYHTTGSWSGLTYTATAVGGAGELKFTVPTGTSSTTVAAGNHTHSYIPTSQKGTASGVAELDSNGKVIPSQLPSFVDDVIEGTYVSSTSFKDTSGTALTGETGKIYVDTSTNKTYRWSGSAFTEISASLALGETSSTAYRGDRGKTAYNHSQATHARTDATATAASSTNGNIKINGTETTVYTHPTSHAASMITGLATVATSGSYNDLSNKPTIPSGAAASKGVDTSISAASTSTNLPTSKAVAAFVEGKGYKTTDNNTTYTFATGDSNGQIKVTPSSGSAYNVSVKGLGSAAYTASTAYAAASHGTHVSYGTSATAVGATASAGSASTVSRSDHTHSLSKSAVTTALGYTPPTTDTNTTYTFATGSSNGTISVTPSGGTAQSVAVKGLGSAAYTASTAYATAAQGTKADNALPKAGGNISGHIYLTGAVANSSTSNTSQIVFGTASNNHVVLSSNTKALIINPTTTGTENQIVLYLEQPSQFPSGISANVTGNLTGTASNASKVANAITFNNGGSGAASGTTFNGSAAKTISYNTVGAAPAYTYSTTDLTAGSSALTTGKLYFVYE